MSPWAFPCHSLPYSYFMVQAVSWALASEEKKYQYDIPSINLLKYIESKASTKSARACCCRYCHSCCWHIGLLNGGSSSRKYQRQSYDLGRFRLFVDYTKCSWLCQILHKYPYVPRLALSKVFSNQYSDPLAHSLSQNLFFHKKNDFECNHEMDQIPK